MKKDIKVYVAGAVRGDQGQKAVIQEIIKYLKQQGFEVMTEHLGAEEIQETFAKKIGIEVSEITTPIIEDTDDRWLRQSTHIIAEVSGGSTGTGIEIERARTKHFFGDVEARILCIWAKEKTSQATAMVTGMTIIKYPEIEKRSYIDVDHAVELVHAFMQSKDRSEFVSE